MPRLSKTTKDRCQVSRWPVRDSNRAPSEYQSGQSQLARQYGSEQRYLFTQQMAVYTLLFLNSNMVKDVKSLVAKPCGELYEDLKFSSKYSASVYFVDNSHEACTTNTKLQALLFQITTLVWHIYMYFLHGSSDCHVFGIHQDAALQTDSESCARIHQEANFTCMNSAACYCTNRECKLYASTLKGFQIAAYQLDCAARESVLRFPKHVNAFLLLGVPTYIYILFKHKYVKSESRKLGCFSSTGDK